MSGFLRKEIQKNFLFQLAEELADYHEQNY